MPPYNFLLPISTQMCYTYPVWLCKDLRTNRSKARGEGKASSDAKAGGCESTWKLKCVYELAAACMYCAFDSKHHYHYD